MKQILILQSGYSMGCEFERPDFTSDGYPVYSRLFICPVCYQRWAQIINEGDPFARPEMAQCMNCDEPSNHPRDDVPGSLLTYGVSCSGIDIDLLQVLPEKLLRREFDLTMEAFK